MFARLLTLLLLMLWAAPAVRAEVLLGFRTINSPPPPPTNSIPNTYTLADTSPIAGALTLAVGRRVVQSAGRALAVEALPRRLLRRNPADALEERDGAVCGDGLLRVGFKPLAPHAPALAPAAVPGNHGNAPLPWF